MQRARLGARGQRAGEPEARRLARAGRVERRYRKEKKKSWRGERLGGGFLLGPGQKITLGTFACRQCPGACPTPLGARTDSVRVQAKLGQAHRAGPLWPLVEPYVNHKVSFLRKTSRHSSLHLYRPALPISLKDSLPKHVPLIRSPWKDSTTQRRIGAADLQGY